MADPGKENSSAAGTGVTIASPPEQHVRTQPHALQMMKYISLFTLMIQNAGNILVMRYARTRGGDMFLSTSAVILAEIMKFSSCLVIIFVQEGGLTPFLLHLKANILDQPMDCLKVSVPSIIYVLQNNLLYVAVSNLDTATYQVTYQLKILTTALFSVFMLKKQLTKMQWISLLTLFIGVSIVQLEQQSGGASKEKVLTEQNATVGLIAVIISCVMSGFAGVYFEKILKGTSQSLWLRNVQLGFLGAIIGFVTMEIKDGDKVAQNGFFFGYDWVVWFVVALQAFGGLLVAVVVKYADNILKGFATSAAIVVSCIASVYLFNFQLSLQFSVGALMVVSSVYLYSKFAAPPPTPLLPKS